jgi:uncharacterized protein YjiS (DUF1127 family)
MNIATAPYSRAAYGRRPRASFLERAAALAKRVALWPVHVVAARRTLAQLAALSEYELRDVGLTRQDLLDLTARPLDEDLTPHLNRARFSRTRRV